MFKYYALEQIDKKYINEIINKQSKITMARLNSLEKMFSGETLVSYEVVMEREEESLGSVLATYVTIIFILGSFISLIVLGLDFGTTEYPKGSYKDTCDKFYNQDRGFDSELRLWFCFNVDYETGEVNKRYLTKQKRDDFEQYREGVACKNKFFKLDDCGDGI